VARRASLIFVFACALVLRALVPSGWMPAADAHGALRLVPCPAASPPPAAHAHHGGSHKPEQHSKGAGDCPFAPLQLASDAPQHPDAVVPPHASAALPTGHMAAPPRATGPPALPPPARGPPALA